MQCVIHFLRAYLYKIEKGFHFFLSAVGSKLGRVRANRLEFICGAFSWPLIDLCHFVSFVRRTPSTRPPGWDARMTGCWMPRCSSSSLLRSWRLSVRCLTLGRSIEMFWRVIRGRGPSSLWQLNDTSLHSNAHQVVTQSSGQRVSFWAISCRKSCPTLEHGIYDSWMVGVVCNRVVYIHIGMGQRKCPAC